MTAVVDFFHIENGFSSAGALVVCASLVALFARVIKTVKWTSIVHRIKNDWRITHTLINWYATNIPKGYNDMLEIILESVNKITPTPFHIRSSLAPVVYLDKPEDIQILLNSSNALEKPYPYRFGNDVLEGSLALLPAHEWKLHRRAMSSMFNTNKLQTYSKIFSESSRLLLNKLRVSADTDEVINLWDSLSILSFDVLSETLLGFNSDTVFTEAEKQKFMHNVERTTYHIANRTVHVWLHLDIIYYVTQLFNGWLRVVQEVSDFVSKAIQKRKKILEERTETGETDKEQSTLMDLLFSLHRTDTNTCDDKALKNDVFLLYSAGFETNSLTSCFTLLMLSMNPDIQSELHKEIDDVLGEEDGKLVTIYDVENMHLLDRCIKETLRLYPGLPIFARAVAADIKLSNGDTIEKDTTVFVIPYLVHRRAEFYENPRVWNPDHFLPENAQKRHPYSYLPFSAGPRGCIGYRFAMIMMKITLATILKKYRFTTDMKMSDIKYNFNAVLRSTDGWKVKLHTR